MSQQEPSREFVEVDITIHVFSVSATMVGVCLTVIGLFFISRRLSHVKSFGEKMLALDALLFLASCILSYIALRARKRGRQHRIERISEEVFFTGLAFMAIICVFIVYELI